MNTITPLIYGELFTLQDFCNLQSACKRVKPNKLLNIITLAMKKCQTTDCNYNLALQSCDLAKTLHLLRLSKDTPDCRINPLPTGESTSIRILSPESEGFCLRALSSLAAKQKVYL